MNRDTSAYPIQMMSPPDKREIAHAAQSSESSKRLKIMDAADDDLPKAPKGWVPHRDPTTYKLAPTPTVKAYRNTEFLNSSHCRSLRMMVEYEETMQRLAANGIKATVQFFGSARALDREQYDAKKTELVNKLRSSPAEDSNEALAAREGLKKLESLEWMIEYIDKTRELAGRLTEWSMKSRLSSRATLNGVSRNKSAHKLDDLAVENQEDKVFKYGPHATDARATDNRNIRGGLFVCTGGAGGFMEAANRGAADVPGGRSIGMGISLPFETGLNPYVTDELAFEYHYFFTRKLCMAFHMQALVVAPGGFGTCDEMFEMMTLKQTGKMQSVLPIVLLGKQYWQNVINWDAFKASGTINPRDVDELLFTDDVDEAFEYIVERLGSSTDSP